MWLCINNIHEKYEIAYHNYAEAEGASSTKLIYSNSAFGQNNGVQSKR